MSVYEAKELPAVTPIIPPDWPEWWDFPPAPGVYAPGFPVTIPDDADLTDTYYTLDVGIDGDGVTADDDVEVTANCLDAALADTDALDGQVLKLTATLEGAPLQLRKSADATMADAIYFLVSNYTGDKYGIQELVRFDTDAGDDGKAIVITAEIMVVVPAVEGELESTVVYHPGV